MRALPWAGLALVILIFYWVEASLRKTPWLFTDELEWSQLSRAIAGTGHAARRGEPHSFESLYSFLIAPAWWIHSTATAYAAIKYLNAVVMCLTALPAYGLARTLLPRRTSIVVALLSIAIPAMAYATSIVPEPLAYLWFTTAALLAVKALARPRPWTVAGAVLLAGGGVFVRLEFVVLPASLVLAAAATWVDPPLGEAQLAADPPRVRGPRRLRVPVQHCSSSSTCRAGRSARTSTATRSRRAGSPAARSRSGSGSCP